ncbi:CRISPR-associated protein Cas4 [Candidatus Micrarchaeota archaeon CG_4_10_14_0_2_um_filter_55_9]|nr:MAG: CRISPR-associated protein Cas4 [Candidatus Micrarchaeota archaeon CG_4_10_14_0_2_um_filter_55_9]QBM01476.1 CRISPR-associated exonuclease Cas4 [uncultured archaeon]
MNYLYCPRITYFENVLHYPQVTTIKEVKGREKHVEFNRKSKRTKIAKRMPKLPRRYNLPLFSKELGFQTVLDCLLLNEEANEAYPLQAKNSFRPLAIYRTMKFQLFVEALLVTRMFDYSVPFGFIKFIKSNDLVKLNINSENMLEVEELIKEIKRVISEEELPSPTPYELRCQDCCYFAVCRRD